MDIFKVFLTAVLSLAVIFTVTKLMGHKQVAQLDFFDYISGITIGSIAAELATELEEPYKPLIALLVYGAASVFLNFLTHKLPRSRKYVNGTPTILMDNGKIYRENLKKAKLDLSEFMLLCREAGYFDLEEIKTAVFEQNGRLSVLPRSDKRPLTPGDMNIKVKEEEIGAELIMDGKILGENLTRVGLNEQWLKTELEKQGYKNQAEIFLATYKKNEKALCVYPIA